jgi:Ser/Thr protein kinase RdoA (MazF antagonist)
MKNVARAASHFGLEAPALEMLTDGLIHGTYKASALGRSIILQQVNTAVFKKPGQIITNYKTILRHLSTTGKLKIPSLLQTIDKQDFWIDEDNSFWRAYEYFENTSTEAAPSVDKIFSAAVCYGEFMLALSDLDIHELSPSIPDFHNLNFRYQQLQQAISKADSSKLKKSEKLLNQTEKRKNLVDFYNNLEANPEFKLRAMHHDAKLSNILFDRSSGVAVCPIDLDTTMPGYFFSDLGDMIRSMVSPAGENASPSNIMIRKDYYAAIIEGYRTGIGSAFTEAENNSIHHAGLLLVYMQAIRFLADYLSNDVYYKTSYPEQNLDRTSNQFVLLEKLESFLEMEYQYKIN